MLSHNWIARNDQYFCLCYVSGTLIVKVGAWHLLANEISIPLRYFKNDMEETRYTICHEVEGSSPHILLGVQLKGLLIKSPLYCLTCCGGVLS